MKQIFLKSFCARCLTLLVLALLSINLAWGTDFTLTSAEEVTQDGITISFAKSSGSTAPTWYTAGLRLYAKNTITISSEKNITNITFNWEKQGSKDFATVTANLGIYSHPSAAGAGTWTGSAKSIIFTLGSSGQLQLNTLSVTVASSSACTIQFDGNGHGTPSSPSITEESVNAGIILPNCTPEEGYVFKGWATAADATTADAGAAGAKYYPSSNCTLYAVYVKTYILTITQPEAGGILTVKNGDAELKTGAILEAGTNLTCEVTNIPEGKRVSRIYAKWGEGTGQSKYKETNPATFNNIATEGISDLEVYVTYTDLQKYTINYIVNGVNTGTQENVYEGTALVFPAVSSFGGKDFMGWVENAIETPTNDKPIFVETSGLAVTKDNTYYAVFATTPDLSNCGFMLSSEAPVAGDNVLIAVLNNENKYYALKSDLSEYALTVVNNKVTNENINDCIWTASEQTISEKTGIAFAVGSGNPLHINSKEVKCANGYTNGTFDFTADKDGGFQFHGIQNDRWLKFNGTSFTYSTEAVGGIYFFILNEPVYTGYSTTVAPRTQDITIASSGYSSFSSTYAVTIPDGITAYYATGVEGNKVSMTEVDGGVIPANEGVIIKGEASQKYTFTETVSDKSFYNNKLVAVSERIEGLNPEVTIENVVYKNYVFTGGQFHPFTSGATVSVGAGKAYLQVEKPTDSTAKLEMSFGDVTGIESHQSSTLNPQSSIYNLNGVRVSENYKGIIIVNGKKYMNK